MAVHFALRPRFRLDEEALPPVRPARLELPPVALPVASYWLALGVFTYALIHVIHSERAPEGDTPVVEAAGAEAQGEPPAPFEAEARASLAPLPADSAPADPQPAAPPPTGLPVAQRPQVLPQEDLLTDLARHDAPMERPRRAAVPELSPERDDAPRRETRRAPRRDSSEPGVAALEPREALGAVNALPSCEAASAAYRQQIDFAGAPGAPDLTQQAFASILENGAYLSGCGVPDHTALEICVAVQEGRAKGVTVVARPANARISACVRRAVASLRFPYSSKLDVTHTRFEALSRR